MIEECDNCLANKSISYPYYFCSKKCEENFMQIRSMNFLRDNRERMKDMIFEFYNELFLLERKNDDEIKDSGWEEGWIEGIKEAEKIANVCPCCKKHVIETLHHIIPRSKGGKDNIENLIFLCFNCHDKIELKTDELLKNNNFDPKTIRSFVVNDSFP